MAEQSNLSLKRPHDEDYDNQSNKRAKPDPVDTMLYHILFEQPRFVPKELHQIMDDMLYSGVHYSPAYMTLNPPMVSPTVECMQLLTRWCSLSGEESVKLLGELMNTILNCQKVAQDLSLLTQDYRRMESESLDRLAEGIVDVSCIQGDKTKYYQMQKIYCRRCHKNNTHYRNLFHHLQLVLRKQLPNVLNTIGV